MRNLFDLDAELRANRAGSAFVAGETLSRAGGRLMLAP
jgi:hypothetical protein